MKRHSGSMIQSGLQTEENLHRRGAMVILIVICLPVILAFSVFTINIAWMQLTRTELRTATDAATRAGSRTLSLTQDLDASRDAAIAAAGRNTVAGDPLLLADSDLQFGYGEPQESGQWDFSERNPDATDINAVRVTGRRVNGSPGGPIPMLMAGLFDRTTFEPVKVATATHTDRDVVLVLDRSGSMGTSTPTGDRWSDLQGAVGVFLDTLELTPQDEQVGLVVYSTNSTNVVDLTMDYQSILDAVNETSVWGWTAIGRGINEGRSNVTDASHARTFAVKTIVVMTDGQHNRGQDPVDAARVAHDNHNVTVHTVTFSAGADQAKMQEVAQVGGGTHWHADDEASLRQVFEEVANNLPTLLTE